MNTKEIAEQLKEFFDTFYKKKLIEKDRKRVVVDIQKIIEFDPKIAEQLLEQPEEVIKLSEQILNLKVRLKNVETISETNLRIRDIRSQHINHLKTIKGTIRQINEVKPKVLWSKYECPSCGNIFTIIQTEFQLKKPRGCACGRRDGFIKVQDYKTDSQTMILEEDIDSLEGNQQPRKIYVSVEEDLTDPDIDFIINNGTRVAITGVVSEIVKGKEKESTFLLKANYIKSLDSYYETLEINEEDTKEIKELSKRKDIFEYLVSSFAPNIYGYSELKEAIILWLFGGITKRIGQDKILGETHILIIGDVGTGKSRLAKAVKDFSPKVRFAGSKTTGAGITAMVVRDELLGWSLQVGAMVLANKGHFIIDELDKVEKDSQEHLSEGMSEGELTINKANIHSTLIAETSVLAIANPPLGRFSLYDDLSKQIGLPINLINRFDLMFAVKDRIDAKEDEKKIETLLKTHQGKIKEETNTDLIKKYIIYAKKNISPKLTAECVKLIKERYIDIRQKKTDSEKKIVPITMRQANTIIKFAEASARVRLSDKILKEDVLRAERLLMKSLMEFALDYETGKIDIDRIASSISSSKREKVRLIRKIIEDIEKMKGVVEHEDLITEANSKGISEEEVEGTLNYLKKQAEIFEPTRNNYKLLK